MFPINLITGAMYLLDYDAFDAYFDDNQSQFKEHSNNLKTSLERDYTLTRDVSAAYVGTRYATDALTVIGGIRYETTDFESDGVLHDKDTNEFTDSHNSNSYSDVLPSINVTYRITDDLLIRGAFSKSLGRPDPGDIKARESRDLSTDGNTLIVSRGTPDLKPRRSDNYDLSLEYYFDGGDSMLSAAVFHKEIDDLIISTSLEIPGIGDEPLTIYKQKKNADIGEVTGLELNAIKNTLDFDFVPEFLHGLGVSANATFLDAEMTYKNTEGEATTVDHFVGQPEFIANVSVFYSFLDRGEVRVAYNMTDDYAHNLKINGSERQEETWEAFEQVDIQARYNITDNLVLRAKVRNLGGHVREQTNNYGDSITRRIEFGRSFWVGMSYTF
jgi:iron complex outermembrane recepter protein